MASVDFAALAALVSPRQVLDLVGWRPVRHARDGEHGRCPMCSSAASRSDVLSCTARHWYCHRCCVGGSALQLYQRIDPQESAYLAARALCARLGVPCPYKPRRPRQPRKPRHRDEAV